MKDIKNEEKRNPAYYPYVTVPNLRDGNWHSIVASFISGKATIKVMDSSGNIEASQNGATFIARSRLLVYG